MGMSIWDNNGNGNNCLAGMGMGMGKGLKLVGMGRNGKAESHSRTALVWRDWDSSEREGERDRDETSLSYHQLGDEDHQQGDVVVDCWTTCTLLVESTDPAAARLDWPPSRSTDNSVTYSGLYCGPVYVVLARTRATSTHAHWRTE